MKAFKILSNGKQKAFNLLNNRPVSAFKNQGNNPKSNFKEPLNNGKDAVGTIQNATKSDASAPKSGGGFKRLIKQ